MKRTMGNKMNDTTSNHTPGPWTVCVDDTGGPFTGWPSVEAPEHLDMSVVHRAGFKQEYWGDLSMRESVANAHLIAAAPDLLEALEAAMDFINKHPGDPDITDEQTQAWLHLKKINPESVITKARNLNNKEQQT